MTDDTVSVTFSATACAYFSGTVQMPLDLWLDKEKGDAWGERAEEYILDALDFSNHLFDFDDLELEDATLD